MADLPVGLSMAGLASLAAVVALTLWLVSEARRAHRERTGPSPAGDVFDQKARRALCWTVGCLAVGAVAQVVGVVSRAGLDDAALGWNKITMHLFGSLAAGCLLRLLSLLLGRGSERRRWLTAATILTALAVVVPFLVLPPRTAHLFEPTWAALVHWVASMALLGWSLAATVVTCWRIAGPSGAGAAGVGMRLVAAGCAIGLIYVGVCLLLLGTSFATGTAPGVVHGYGLDVSLQQIAEVVIVIGLVWTSIDQLLPRVLRRASIPGWFASVAGGLPRPSVARRCPDPFPALREEVERIRPWWSALASTSPDLVHFPRELSAVATTTDQARFQLQRMLTEIHDVQRLACVYVDEADRDVVHAVAERAGLLPSPHLDTAVWQACMLVGMDRRGRGAERRSDPLELPEPTAARLTQAATDLSRDLPAVHPLRERLLRHLHDSAMLTWRR